MSDEYACKKPHEGPCATAAHAPDTETVPVTALWVCDQCGSVISCRADKCAACGWHRRDPQIVAVHDRAQEMGF